MKQQTKMLTLSFLTGFSVMVIELTAARIISPILGNSIYTWTSVIGVILLGTSAGNHFGGKIIDKYNKTSFLAFFFLIASIFVMLIPIISTKIVSITTLNMPIWLTVVCASMFLFVVPAFFLGATYPMIFKQFLINIESVGQKAGALSASWSIGSIIGTFLTGFFFIGYIGSSKTLLSISCLLFLCGCWVFKKTKQRLFSLAFFLLAIAIYVAIGSNTSSKLGLIFSKESNYYNIKVIDDSVQPFGDIRTLLLDADAHSIESLSDKKLDLYTNSYPIFSIFNKNIRNIAVLGGGSLALSNKFKDYYPNANIATVELDPAVTQTAKKYFHTSDYVADNTVVSDGRIFLSQSHQEYDVIFSDAYNSFISVPWHLATQEFFKLAQKKLTPDGVFAINLISAQKGETAGLYESMVATFSSVFENYYAFSYGKSPTSTQNIILVGVNSSSHLSDNDLRSQLLTVPDGNRLSLHLINRADLPKKNSNAIILTDDFAPTDRLMMPIMNAYFQPHIELLRKDL